MRQSVLLVLLVLCGTELSAQTQTPAEDGVGISQRLQYEIDRTKDLNLGYVPKNRLIDAYQEREALLLTYPETASPLSWIDHGPISDVVGPSNGNTRANAGVTSGRMRAVWVDLADPTYKRVWVGGVNGGIWSTLDITASPATWVRASDYLGNMAIASICQDPTDHNIMYVGTGEKAINADAVRGSGIWRSTDHGITWSFMPGTANYWNISKVQCDAAGNLYVGCNTLSNNQGMLRYTKATGTWTNITPTGLAGRIPDFELTSTGKLHISCGYYNTATSSSAYRYTANPATVTSSTWTSPTTTFPTQYNVAFASKGDTLYALSANASWQVATIYKSTDGGANWAAFTAPAFTSGQAWYCIAIGVDPNNSNNVLVGSLDCYRSTNGGTTWAKVSNWVGTAGQYVHADQQIIVWRPNNQVLVGSDGGIHYSADGGITYRDRNVGLSLKQFYSVAVHPTLPNYFLGGTQDNGTHVVNASGLATSTEVTGGDGAFCHIDRNQPSYQFGAYVYNQYRRSTNGGTSWSNVNYSNSIGSFINPTDYDDSFNIMYCGAGSNAYIRWDNPQTGNTFTSVALTALGGAVTNVKVSPYSNHTVYFGSSGTGKIVRVANANTATPTATVVLAGSTTVTGTVSSIEFGKSEDEIIATVSNYGATNVWVTYNGGINWTAVDGNLPDMPVRWALFSPNKTDSAIIGTEAGVWQTDNLNGAATIWTPEPGFPAVRVDMLQYRPSDGRIVAATHGRGIFSATYNITALPVEAILLTLRKAENGSIELKWKAGIEDKVAKYVVEESTDGLHFNSGYTTAPQGNYTTYLFQDHLLSEKNYYRIAAIGNNGQTLYSNVISYWLSGFEKPINLYPNPAQGIITVSFMPLGKKSINLYNAHGALVKSFTTNDVLTDVNVADLPAGRYNVVVATDKLLLSTLTMMKQ